MHELPYLFRLAQSLSDGLAGLENDRRERHRAFVLAHQQADGGFCGRADVGETGASASGAASAPRSERRSAHDRETDVPRSPVDSDLYYTSFAVRTLMMLGGMSPATAAAVAGYLQQQDWRQLGVIDLMNWLATALAVEVSSGEELFSGGSDGESQGMADEVAARLESVRTADGGYAKSSEGASGSTYHSFLVLLAYQLIGQGPPRPNALIQFLYDRQRDDGGFVEIGPMRRSGTNPTAAAAAMLRELGGLDEEIRRDIGAFLNEVRSPEGGFQANTRIPFADSLSTFTAILTAQDLGLEDLYDPEQVRRWIETQLEFPTGGFRAATWDEAADVEYTFYGLGVLGLLQDR
jgi:geranylgeranyl transferase type-2 subunit beta